MNKLKALARSIYALAREILTTEPIIDRALILFAAIGLATQLAFVAGYLYQSRADQPIVAATDNDAGVAVSVAVNTQLYSDNGWRPYGPVYYRLVRIAQTLVKDPTPPNAQLTPAAIDESSHHFTLMLISLFSMMTLAFLVASVITDDIFWRLLATVALSGAFLQNHDWAEMLFRAHPDHLFALTIGLATWRTWCWLRNPDSRKQLVYFAAAWGLAAATKMTVLLFAPTLLLLLVFPFDLEKTPRKLLLFIPAALLTYLIVTFPQGFAVQGVLKFLIEQKRNVVWGDLDFLKKWATLFFEQTWRPALVLAVFSLLVPLRRDALGEPEKNALKKLAVLMILPILMLFSRRILSPYVWYPLPFIACLLVGGSILLIKAVSFIPILASVRESRWTKIAAFFALPFAQPALSPQLNAALAREGVCRAEARAVKEIINNEARNGGHILVDPYLPYDRVFHDKEVEMAWEIHPDRIQTGKPTMIGLRTDYYEMYLPKSEGGNGATVLHIHDAEKTAAFYRLFHTPPGQPERKEATDPYGGKWHKNHSDICHFELWERER